MTLEKAAEFVTVDELFGDMTTNKLLVLPVEHHYHDGTVYFVIPDWPDKHWKQFFAYPLSVNIPDYLRGHVPQEFDNMPMRAQLSADWMVLTLDELISYNKGLADEST